MIGGGINGAGIAWEAALRGYSVALIEKADFGAATSAGCFKIIHGGLRYLQHFDLPRLYESVREQQILRKISPHLIKPFPFLVPCYGYGMKGKEAMRLGLMLYEVLTCTKNQGVSSEQKLPSHKVLSKKETLDIAPHLDSSGLRGGIVYYDCQMTNVERYTFSVVASASSAGATVCNYLEARSCEVDSQKRIKSVNVVDSISGEEFSIAAKYVISASGPWTKHVISELTKTPTSEKKFFSKGIQLVLPQIIDKYAVAVESRFKDGAALVSRGGRSYFLQPWRGSTLVGTSDEIVETRPDDFLISKKEIASFLDEVKSAYPDDRLSVENVKYAFGGLREVDEAMLSSSKGGDATVAREASVDDVRGISNLTSVVGVKYTTFRALSEKVVNHFEKREGFKKTESKSAETVLYDVKCVGDEFYKEILDNEMVVHLDDFVFRRTDLASLGLPENLEEIAKFVGEQLGWSEEEREFELREVVNQRNRDLLLET